MAAPRLDRLGQNLLINGNFDYWERGTTISGASIYGPDRWRGNSATGSSQRRDSSFSGGLPSGARFGMQFTSIVGGGGFGQRIEAKKLVGLVGKYATLSFKSGLVSGTTQLSMNVGIPTVIDNYSSRTFPYSFNFGITPATHTGPYTSFVHTFQITSDMVARGFEVNIFGDATVWSIMFSQIMLVLAPDDGSDFVPSVFSYHSHNIVQELHECQRYYWQPEGEIDYLSQNNSLMDRGHSTVSGTFEKWVPFPVEMRANPLMNISTSGLSSNIIDGSSTVFDVRKKGFAYSIVSGGAGTYFTRMRVRADAEL